MFDNYLIYKYSRIQQESTRAPSFDRPVGRVGKFPEARRTTGEVRMPNKKTRADDLLNFVGALVIEHAALRSDDDSQRSAGLES